MTEPNAEPQGADNAVGPSPMDRRSAAFASIEESRAKILRDGGLVSEPEPAADAPVEDPKAADTTTPAPEAEPTPGDGEEPAEPVEAAPEPPPKSEPGEGDPVYGVMVDGEERKVSLSELTRNYAMGESAQQKLTMASDVLRRVEDLQARLTRGEPIDDTATPGDAPASDKPDAKTADGKDPLEGIDFKNVVQTLQYGSQDEGEAALRNLVIEVSGRATGGANVSPEAITTQVMDQVNFHTALKQFGETYSDIVEDQTLAQRTGSRANQIYLESVQAYRANGTPMPSYAKIFSQAGDETREWLDRLRGKSADPDSGEDPEPADPSGNEPSSTMKDRIERKKSLPQPPTARAAPTKPPAPEKPATPPSEVERARAGIADIKKARGQAA